MLRRPLSFEAAREADHMDVYKAEEEDEIIIHNSPFFRL